MPGKGTLEAEIREIMELGKGIGSTKVMFKHFIGLRVPADIYLLPIGPILSGGNGRGPAPGGAFCPHVLLAVYLLCYLLLSGRLAAIGAFGDRLIAPSAFYEVQGAWVGTFS